jgi:serine phosphatase RsbU (regulator of sigma subunit)/ABC-type amino acid transport substrate-binding protein
MSPSFLIPTAVAASAFVLTTPVTAQVELTERQTAWLGEHPVIRVAPDPDFPPFEFFDEDGRYDGIAADHLKLLEARLGVRFEVVREASWDDVLEKARRREVDLLAAVVKTPQRAEYLAFTEPHIKLPGVIIANTSEKGTLTMADLAGREVVVVSGYVWEDLLTNDHPRIQLVTVPTIGTALEMVSFGVVDAMIGDQATTTYFIQQQGLTNLRVAGRPGYDDGLAIGVRDDWPELVPIIEAALATITPAEKARINDRWIHLEQPSVFRRREFWIATGSTAAGIALLVGAILAWNRSLKRLVDIRTRALNEELAWRTQAEEELRQHRDHLDELVTVRTAQLSQANERMKRDLEAAARVQQSLLPTSMPEMREIKFSWHYRPCDELAGDILNVFQLDRTHVGIYVADVSGHGVAASLLSVAVSRVLTPESSTSGLLVRPDTSDGVEIVPPLEVAQELNRRFPMHAQGDKYFTILYGVVNIKTREFRFVSAGHPPIVRWGRHKAPEAFALPGMAIGWVDEPDYEEHRTTLEAGERLLIYSDGVPEAMNPENEQFGNERLLEVLGDNTSRTLELGVADLLFRVEQWCGETGPKDDVSVLALEIGSAS